MRIEIGGDSFRRTIHSIPTRSSHHINTDQIPIAVYAPGSLYYPVVQQPQNNPAYVSPNPGQVTQFRIPATFGTIGLLAHNNLAGSAFFSLHPGQEVVLVYEGQVEEVYEVASIEEYQAIEPASPYSDFIDIDQNQYMDSNTAFEKVYEQPNRVVFQTCIARDGIPNWGRLFVTAIPVEEVSS